MKKKDEEKNRTPPTIENKRARRNYEILDTVEAGIVLTGTEVKSLRSGRAEIADAHVTQKGNELFLLNLRIEPYKDGGSFNHEESRTRKLLLHRKEIVRLAQRIHEKGLTIFPLKIYFNHAGRVKVLLAIGRGKKLHDKRQDERAAQAKLEIARAMRERS